MRVVALTPDLADRSKVSAAFPDAVHVGAAALLGRAVEEHAPGLVLVDLTRAGAPEAVANLNATCRVVGFGPHVDDALAAAATAAGIEWWPRSRFFRELGAGRFTETKQSGNSPPSS